MRKFITLFLSVLLLLLIPVNSLAEKYTPIDENKENTEIIYEEKEIGNTKEFFLKNNKTEIFVDGKKVKIPRAALNGKIKNEQSGKVYDVSTEQATQLLEVKKVKDEKKGYKYVSEFVTIAKVKVDESTFSNEIKTNDEISFFENIKDKISTLNKFSLSSKALASPATDALIGQKWVGNVNGYVKVYYHKDRYDVNMDESIDMNYIQTWWEAGSGAFVSNRSAELEQVGMSHWGDHVNNTERKTVYPTSNSLQQFDAPDSWYPVYEGNVGAHSNSTAVINGSSYSLEVTCYVL